MSVARGFGLNGFKYFTNVCKPIDINLNFVVDSTNGNGLGIRSLKSNGFVENVFMHTSSTPGAGTGGFVNPNPASGFALIQFKNNFNYYLGGFSGFVSPTINTTTSTTSGLSIGQPYIITVLGTTTLAEWQAIGLPLGLTPTVGQAFVAIATGTGGSHTGKVGTPSVSGISSIEVVGDTTQSANNSSISKNAGARLLVQFCGPTFAAGAYTPAGTISRGNIPVTAGTAGDAVTNNAGALNSTGGQDLTVDLQTFTGSASSLTGTITYGPVAPANGSVVGMCVRFDGSSVTIDGL